MCKMNFWCSFTIIFIILIAALVITNSVDVHVARKQHGKSEELLKDFRKEAFKTKKDIEVLANFAKYGEEHGKRQRRQTDNFFDNLSNNKDIEEEQFEGEQFEDEQLQSNCSPNICKAKNCAGGVCRTKSTKNSLKSSKELNSFLSNLKLENKNMPREISFAENQPEDNEENGKENEKLDGEKSLKEEYQAVKNELKVIDDRQKRLKFKNNNKSDLKFPWLQNREKSKFPAVDYLKENSKFVKENQLDADVSSCHQCSQNKGKDIFENNCKTNKDFRPDVTNENKTFSKNSQNIDVDQFSLTNFERKYNKNHPSNNEDDDEEDEDDEMYQLRNPKKGTSASQAKNELQKFEFNLPAVKTSKDIENLSLGTPSLPLNDQLEEGKNNLSHEANYKLSKDEQDAAENRKYGSWKWSVFKRSHPFNAMNEIKLKTSQRLMKKGFGASLPSYSLAETRKDLFIENKLRQREEEIFQCHNRKHKNFDEMDRIENDFGESNNHLDDLEEMPLEPDVASLPITDWSRTRQKRISEISGRYKRELSAFQDQSLSEAQNWSSKSAQNNIKYKNVEIKAEEAKGITRNKDNKKDLDSQKYAKQSFSKALINNKHTKDEEDQYEKVLKLERKLYTQKIGDTFRPSLHENHKRNTESLNHQNLTKALSSRKNKIKAFKADHYLSDRRRYLQDLSKQNQFSKLVLDKGENAEKSSEFNTKPFAVKPLKVLKRIKRFNPRQTLDLKIYQKLHNVKALKNQGKRRSRRSCTSKTLSVKSSAAKPKFLINFTNILMKKSVQIRNRIKELIKNSLPFQKLSSSKSSNSKAFPTENAEEAVNALKKNEPDEELNDRIESSSIGNLNLDSKSFTADSAKSLHKTKNLKLRLLKYFPSQFLRLKQYLKSFQEENIAKSCDKENLQARVFKNENTHDENSTKLNTELNQTFAHENQRTVHRELQSKSTPANSFKNTELKSKTESISQNLKRKKRSLDTTTLHADQPKTDALKYVNKRSYLFNYGDFYKPNNKLVLPVKTPSKLDINIDNSQKLLKMNEMMPPVKQHINFENYQEMFNMPTFDRSKNFNPQTQKFDRLKFDNLWPDIQSQKHFKRFLKTSKNQNSKTKTENFRIPYKRNNDVVNKNPEMEIKTTKLPAKVQILKDKYLNDLENFNKNYKFNANNFNSVNNSMDYSEKLGLQLNNEILNCKTFASLEEFINSLPKNLTQKLLCSNTTTSVNTYTTEPTEKDLNILTITPEVTTTIGPLILDSTTKCSQKTEEETVNEGNEETSESREDFTQPNELETSDEETSTESEVEDMTEENVYSTTADPEDVKINISINAHVHGNPKDQHFCGNGSFTVIPGLLDDRLRRNINLSPFEKMPTKFLRITNQDTNHEESEDLSDLISGKFSANAVKSILATVQESPHLKALWPSLNPSQKLARPSQINFYAIRNQQNEPQVRNSEKLLEQAMSAINAIVEQQARLRTCVPLRPDLQAFYNIIVQSRQQQDMTRVKRQNKNSAKKSDSSYQLNLLDANKIEEKTKIVKKLLKQYEELPQEDQQQMAVVRDDLIKNLIILRQLQDNERRQENALREKRENDWDASDEQVIKDLQSQYSLQFLKLLKAAELYREIKDD